MIFLCETTGYIPLLVDHVPEGIHLPIAEEFEDTKGTDRNRKSEDRQDHGQQNETKDKHRAHNTTLKTKAGVTRTLQKPG